MPERRAFHQCVNIGGSIYVLGGFDGVRDLNSVCRLDTSTGASRFHINPKLERETASSKTEEGEYAVSSSLAPHPRTHLTGRWSYDVPMRVPRSGFAAGVVRGRILVMGGHNGLECLGSCDSIDPREGKWRSEPELLYHRCETPDPKVLDD